MTVQELKSYFSQFNIKPKTNIPDDYTVTIEDIIKGNIFQKFIDNNSFTKIVSGLNVIDGNICYVYPVLKRIEIKTEENFPPCGGREEIKVEAYYEIYSLDTNGFTNVISSEKVSPINTLITLDNDLFTYDKPYLVNEKVNDSEKNIEVNIHATYYSKAVKYESVKHVVQNINKNTPWLVEKEPTQFIKLSLTEDVLPKEGGITYAIVERTFSRIYYMKDSCGNVIGEKCETGLTEDITNKCLITCSNKKEASILKNVIKVEPQKIESEERALLITARFMDFTATAELYQEEGGKITYEKELTCADGKTIKFIDLETSLPVIQPVALNSKIHRYVDGVYDGFIYDANLTFEADKDWVDATPLITPNGIIFEVTATTENYDKENDREATITISNGEKQIKLIMSQQALSVIEEEYCCDYVGGSHFTYKSLKNEELYFKPYKILVYEDYSQETTEIEADIKVSATCVSRNSSLLNLAGLDKKGEKHYLNFFNQAKESVSDIDLKITPIFLSGNTKIFTGEDVVLTVKGKDVIDYNYELCFDEHNKLKTVKWYDSVAHKFINYNSWKYTLTNGKITNKETIPVKIGLYDEKGEEYFDDSFSIKLLTDKVMAFPVKTNENVKKKYTITQKETGKKIYLDLYYEKNIVTRSIPLKVIVYSDNVTYDLWTGDNGYLLIDEDTVIKLTPCWLSPTMKDKKDTAYNGTVVIKEGSHQFKAVNVVLLTQKGEYTKINCNKTIDVNSSTKEILFEIKCP